MKRKIQIAVSVLVAGVLLWFLFKDIEWSELFAALKSISIVWLLVAQIPLWLSFLTRVQRWSYIVRADAQASFRHMFSATQIGFLANFTLPLRAGEIIRPLVLNRLTGIPFSKGLALVALDRVTDLIGLITIMLVSLVLYRPKSDLIIPPEFLPPGIAAFTLPKDAMQNGVMVMLFLVFILIGGLVLLYLKRSLALRISDAICGLFSEKLKSLAHGMLESFAEGLHVFRSARDMILSITWSLITWACFLLILVALLKAFHLQVTWGSPFIIETVITIAIAIPISVGFIGQFQAAVILGLLICYPEVQPAEALAMGLLFHFINLLGVVIAGLLCLSMEGLNLFELESASQHEHGDLDHRIVE